MMSFLYPAFLLGGLAIAVPIVLHLLRRDVAPEVPFSAVRLLRRSPVERADRRKLRDILLLAARIVALLLLAAAFARPYVQGATPAPLRVVAIDRSYSMGAPGRFEKALELARTTIDSAASGERIAVIAFDDRAEIVAPPGGAGDARAALSNLKPGYGATRYAPLFQQALDLGAGAIGRLVVISDLQRTGWEGASAATLPEQWQLEIQDAGATDSNLAVTAVVVEASRVVASIRNTGTARRTGRARVTLDGREVAAADYAVDAGGVANVPIAYKAPQTGALAVSIEDAVGAPADNVRYVALGARGLARALIVANGGQSGLFVARALQTSSDEEGGFDGDVVTGPRLSAMGLDEVSNYPVVVLLSTRGIERRGRETLVAHIRSGGGLLAAAGPDLESSVMSALTEWDPAWKVTDDGASAAPALTFAATDLRHPIFRPFGALAANLGQVRFERTWRVAPEGWSVVARFSNGAPALLERSLGQGRVVLLASDVDRRWNDFPLHPAFVPFTIEAVRYAAGDRRHAREYTVAQAPPGTGPEPGVFRSPDNRVSAVNVDIREGSLDRVTTAAFNEAVRRTSAGATKAGELQARQTEARQSYWQYGLLIMIAALVAESFVGRA